MSAGVPIPWPDPTCEVTGELWRRAERGELAIPRCEECRAWVWYPQPRCRACGSDRVTWEAVSGRGTLFTWVVVHHAFLPEYAGAVPFTTALVALEEDPSVRVPTTLVDCSPEDLSEGLPVEVVFRPLPVPGSDRLVPGPLFRPSAPAAADAPTSRG
jgi:uncharacterized OB-fold protein